DYMRYHESVMKSLLPAPPQPWGSLRGRLVKLDTDIASRRRWPLFGVPSAWMAAAASLLVAVIGYRVWREPVVTAAELLRNASAPGISQPPRGRIQVKTPSRPLLRARSLRVNTAAVARQDGAAEIEALFAAAHFSWEEPLSARSFAAWRDQ